MVTEKRTAVLPALSEDGPQHDRLSQGAFKATLARQVVTYLRLHVQHVPILASLAAPKRGHKYLGSS